MAIEHIKSLVHTNRDATPSKLTNAAKSKGHLQEAIGVVAVAASASIGSTYKVAEISSSERLSEILLDIDALGVGCAGDIGLYEPTIEGGDVVDVDLFAAAQALAAASQIAIRPAPQNADKLIWELLGLTADPAKHYDVVITLTGAAVAGGDVSVRTRTVA